MMEEKVLGEVIAYLGEDYTSDMGMKLETMVKRAIGKFKAFRRYPEYYTKDMINEDLEKHSACLFDLVIYWYAKEGAEFESFHIENGIQRAYISEYSVFSQHSVMPIVTLT